jgi:hypothetical protein
MKGESKDWVEVSTVPVGRESASSSGRSNIGESKSVGGGSSRGDDNDGNGD